MNDYLMPMPNNNSPIWDLLGKDKELHAATMQEMLTLIKRDDHQNKTEAIYGAINPLNPLEIRLIKVLDNPSDQRYRRPFTWIPRNGFSVHVMICGKEIGKDMVSGKRYIPYGYCQPFLLYEKDSVVDEPTAYLQDAGEPVVRFDNSTQAITINLTL